MSQFSYCAFENDWAVYIHDEKHNVAFYFFFPKQFNRNILPHIEHDKQILSSFEILRMVELLQHGWWEA